MKKTHYLSHCLPSGLAGEHEDPTSYTKIQGVSKLVTTILANTDVKWERILLGEFM